MDRIGKGIRGAPRDALVADVTPHRHARRGLRIAASAGHGRALLGPLAAIALMAMLNDNVRAVFWMAVLPAIAAVLAVGLRRRRATTRGRVSPRLGREFGETRPRGTLPHWRDLRRLGGAFWAVVAIGAVFTLARFSEAFLVLRAYDAGLSYGWTPLALAVMNLTYVASAYPAGRLSDRLGRTSLLVIGLAMLIVADLVLAAAPSVSVILLGVALWGLHMGLTQGLLAAMVADTAPAALRGSAFGVFYFVSGLVTLLASLLAGALWEWHGPSLTFIAGAVFSALALAGLLWWRSRFDHRTPSSTQDGSAI